ncbi:tyrosine-type recombinase/integrase [Nocardioides sp. NPDC004968]|uniref:tyrosine-type recombinase/integrase n=1 Tax=Nocardioides sp. NPDC004968 TaxID=3155894 RepID=UPI0033B71DB8
MTTWFCDCRTVMTRPDLDELEAVLAAAAVLVHADRRVRRVATDSASLPGVRFTFELDADSESQATGQDSRGRNRRRRRKPPRARAANPEPPEQVREAIAWISKRVRLVEDLADTATTRQVLLAISLKLDGRPAAAKNTDRKRAALSSAIGYAVELGHLDSNPLQRVKVKRARDVEELDTRVVVNHRQAKRILAAVRASEPELEAFIGCIYYGAMRPAEVRDLHRQDLTLPEAGWGEALLAGSYQDPGKGWTDDGELGEERGLKHRARKSTRPVPLPPPLVEMLRRHLDTYETGPDGRLFVTRVGKWGHTLPKSLSRPVPLSAVGRVMKNARTEAFTEDEQKSPLARRAYDLRHAAVSTWLAAGTPPPLVAKWAGHSVSVLLTVYAHAVDGQEEAARTRIEQALADDDEAA